MKNLNNFCSPNTVIVALDHVFQMSIGHINEWSSGKNMVSTYGIGCSSNSKHKL